MCVVDDVLCPFPLISLLIHIFSFAERHFSGHRPHSAHHMNLHEEEEPALGRIIRTASIYERQQLPGKFHDEENVKEVSVM